MDDVLAQIAQIPDDDGRGWGSWYYLLVLIILPVVNAIKDKYVKRAEQKRAEQTMGQASDLSARPKIRPVEAKHETAKPLRPRPVGPAVAQAPHPPVAKPLQPKRVTPRPARPMPARAAPAPAGPKPRAKPPSAAPKPVHRAGRPQERVAPVPARPAKQPVARTAEPPGKRSAVAGVDVQVADPTVDVHGADPKVSVKAARPRADVREADPAVDVHGIASAEAPGLALEELGEHLTPEQMRRVVILSEIFRPPLALRENPSGGWAGNP
jgi:hypothetical protein